MRLTCTYWSLALFFVIGCSSEGDLSRSILGQIELSDAEVAFGAGDVAVGGSIESLLVVRNLGSGTLTVKSVTLEGPPSLELVDSISNVALEPKPAGGDLQVIVRFTRQSEEDQPAGELVIISDTRAAGERELRVPVRVTLGAAVVQVSPPSLDFGLVGSGEKKQLTVTVSNTGAAALDVSEINVAGSPDFKVDFGGAFTLAPGETRPMDVVFAPAEPAPASGTLTIYSSDPVRPGGVPVTLQGNHALPCIAVNPKSVTFGGKKPGTKAVQPVEVTNCGTVPLVLDGLMLSAESHPDFVLHQVDLPLEIPINDKRELLIEYVPAVVSPLNADNLPVMSEATILLESNAWEPIKEVFVSAFGTDQICCTPVILVQEGEQVVPQTNLHLLGQQSTCPTEVAQWEWSVKGPVGDAGTFIPSNTFPDPTFEANLAGVYTFELRTWGSDGTPSCLPATVDVLVVPDEAIHVELLWTTPNDPDETDIGPEAGADLDLHFCHPLANTGVDLDGDGVGDPWFDQPFDAFWFNAKPNWASFDPSIDDDPGLDRDDTDGAGPENLNLNIPENLTYKVGVHYWSDHEYGPSLATVRIYVYGQLVFEVSDVKMVNHDMWDVARIAWPSGKITLVTEEGGGYKITPSYINPDFFQP